MAARRSSAHFSKIPFATIEVIALGVSTYLALISTHLIGGKLPCARSRWIACESAVQGPFSHLGPLSVAGMGVVYYLIQLSLTAGMCDRAAQICKALTVGAGLFFVAYLRAIEIVWLKKLCPWCWGVAALTLIDAGLIYYLVAPPLPRLHPAKLIIGIIIGFLLLVGAETLLEMGLKTGRLMLNQERTSLSASESTRNTEAETAIEKPAKQTPAKHVTTPAPTATPVATQAAVQSPMPSATAAPKVALPPEPELIDVPEAQILKSRGWRHAGSGADVIKYVKAKCPVLVLAYDPFCSHCHDLITTIINTPEFSALPVTFVAIQEDKINGQLDKLVGNDVPTMLLFGCDGTVLWKHTWTKASLKELTTEIRAALAPAPAPASGTPAP